MALRKLPGLARDHPMPRDRVKRRIDRVGGLQNAWRTAGNMHISIMNVNGTPVSVGCVLGAQRADTYLKQPTPHIMPLDPVEPATSDNANPMAPPYVDEDPNRAMVEKGMRVAENEKRDAVVDSYESAAAQSDEPEEALDDIEYPKGADEGSDPELSAIREDESAR